PFQSGCKQWRCFGPHLPYWQTANFSAPSQRASYCAPPGYCLFQAGHPPDTSSDTATAPADSTGLSPARTWAGLFLSPPTPAKRPSPAWTGPDAVYIVLPAAVPPIPFPWQRGNCCIAVP